MLSQWGLLGLAAYYAMCTVGYATEFRSLGNVIGSGKIMGPVGGFGRFQNLLLHSEDFSTTWTTSSSSVLVDNVVSPDGLQTADKVTTSGTNGYVQQIVTTTVTLPYTLSVWAKNSTCTTIDLALVTNGSGAAATTVSNSSPSTADWERYTATMSTGGGTSPTTVTAKIYCGGNSGNIMYLWGAQLEEASSAGVYKKTTNGASPRGGSTIGLVNNGYTTTNVTDLRADVNKDGYVNGLDLNFVNNRSGCTPSGNPCWNVAYEVDNLGNPLYGKDADLNGDGTVDASDAAIVTAALRSWSGVTLNGTTSLKNGLATISGSGDVTNSNGGLLINYTGNTAGDHLFQVESDVPSADAIVFQINANGGLQMGSGIDTSSNTAVTKIVHGTCSQTPPNLAANSSGTTTCTATGVTTSSRVFVTPRTTLFISCLLAGAAPGTDVITIRWKSLEAFSGASAVNVDWLAIQ